MRVQEGPEDEEDFDDEATEQAHVPSSSNKPEGEEQGESEALQAVEMSSSRQLMEDTLNTYYLPLEVWYMRTIIEKVYLSQPPSLRNSSGTGT